MADTQSVSPTQPSSGLVASEFRQRYGEPVGVFRAPGRVNLIGEHTDYNDGFVMPCALGFSAYVAAGKRKDGTLSIYSLDYQESASIALNNVHPGSTGRWTDYPRGVAAVLRADGLNIP